MNNINTKCSNFEKDPEFKNIIDQKLNDFTVTQIENREKMIARNIAIQEAREHPESVRCTNLKCPACDYLHSDGVSHYAGCAQKFGRPGRWLWLNRNTKEKICDSCDSTSFFSESCCYQCKKPLCSTLL